MIHGAIRRGEGGLVQSIADLLRKVLQAKGVKGKRIVRGRAEISACRGDPLLRRYLRNRGSRPRQAVLQLRADCLAELG
jgi:hypothetical protein